MDVLGYSQAHHSVVDINPFPGSPSSTFPWTPHVYTTLWVSVYPPHIGHCGERDDSGGLGDDNKGNIHITNAINLELPCGFLRRAHTASIEWLCDMAEEFPWSMWSVQMKWTAVEQYTQRDYRNSPDGIRCPINPTLNSIKWNGCACGGRMDGEDFYSFPGFVGVRGKKTLAGWMDGWWMTQVAS